MSNLIRRAISPAEPRAIGLEVEIALAVRGPPVEHALVDCPDHAHLVMLEQAWRCSGDELLHHAKRPAVVLPSQIDEPANTAGIVNFAGAGLSQPAELAARQIRPANPT